MALHPSISSLSAALAILSAASCAAAPLRDHSGPYEIQVLIDGAPARTFYHSRETYVLGRLGARYTLRVRNRSARRVEAVVSVDGRDVIDGQPGDFRGKRGYLVPAWGQVDIDGWRISGSDAAAFRFSRVSDSYAAKVGSAREVGVIGVAVFPERWIAPRPVYVPPIERPCDGCEVPREEQGHYYAPPAGDGSRAEAEGPMAASPPAPTVAPPGAGSSSSGWGEGRTKAPALADETLSRRDYGRPRERPGLGTEFGEQITSPVQEVEFARADSRHPSEVLGVRYNDHDGLIAMGIDVDGRFCCSEPDLRRTATPFPVVDRRYATPPPGWRR